MLSIDHTTMTLESPELTAGMKRPREAVTLKEQVAILTQVQNNLISLIASKLDVTEEEISNCYIPSNVSTEPVKRNPRVTPGIFTDSENRKYFINSFGTFVYKRPCGKPKKDKKWCYAKGEWVAPGEEVSESDAMRIDIQKEDTEEDSHPEQCIYLKLPETENQVPGVDETENSSVEGQKMNMKPVVSDDEDSDSEEDLSQE